jgi:hypothetical protein
MHVGGFHYAQMRLARCGHYRKGMKDDRGTRRCGAGEEGSAGNGDVHEESP